MYWKKQSGRVKALFICLLFFACSGNAQHQGEHDHGHNEANRHMHQRPIENMIAAFESEDRAEWQKPEAVIALFGDLEGKTIMDLGAGTGYFSFRLADMGAKVIAADVNEDFQEFIKHKMEEKGYGPDQIELRKVPFESPLLEANELDAFLTVNTYHHIDDRIQYFREVKNGLKPGGILMIVDYIKEETPMGPPVAMRLSSAEVVKELEEAGFFELQVITHLLDYQYVVIGGSSRR